MPSDIPTEDKTHSRKWHLSHVLAAGFFLQMIFVVGVFFALSYFLADFLVSEERRRISFQSAEISNLVGESRLNNLNHILLVAVENKRLLSGLENQEISQIDTSLTSFYYNQLEGDLDLLLVVNEHGSIVWNIGGEIQDLSPVVKFVELNIQNSSTWLLGSFEDSQDAPPLVFALQKSEVIDPINGRVMGYLVGGIFLTQNFDLVSEIRNRTGAEKAELHWKDQIISSTGTGARDKAGIKKTALKSTVPAFTSNFLTSNFPGQPLQTVLYFAEKTAYSLQSTYVLFAVIALIIITVLTAMTVIFVQKAFQKPVGRLVGYANEVKKRSPDAIVPHSIIREFSELADNLNEVFYAFQNSENRFQDFASIASDSMWESDIKGRAIFLSRSSKSNTSTPKEEILGKAAWEVKGVDMAFSNWKLQKDSYKNQTPFHNFIFRRTDPNGEQLYWSTSGKPVYDMDGKYTGFRGTATNITEQIRSQALAVEADQKLRQSQKLEVVGQLTGGIAHDFNNILGIVLGNLEILETMLPHNDKALDRVGKAQKGILRGADITRKLLGFSRKSAQEVCLTLVNPFIQNLEDLISKSVTATIEVETILEDELWNVAIDPGDLEDAILNLSLNAKDAMPEGGKLVIETGNKQLDENYVRQNPEGKTGDFVMISVSDSGTGISKDLQHRILEPFFTTKKQGQGTGLGLSMVYGFIQRSEGHLAIYSEIGIGTTFRLYLPRASAIASDAVSASQQETTSAPSGKGRVLVVEDEEDLRDVAQSLLEKLGYETLSAENAQQALDILAEDKNIDLLFTDIVMPGELNGFQLAQTAHKNQPNLKILVTSGFTKNMATATEDQDSFMSRIQQDLLSKPYNFNDLAHAINNVMQEPD